MYVRSEAAERELGWTVRVVRTVTWQRARMKEAKGGRDGERRGSAFNAAVVFMTTA